MEITKARLKQIIMEEIQKFMVVEEDTEEEAEAKKKAAEETIKNAGDDQEELKTAYETAASIVEPDED